MPEPAGIQLRGLISRAVHFVSQRDDGRVRKGIARACERLFGSYPDGVSHGTERIMGFNLEWTDREQPAGSSGISLFHGWLTVFETLDKELGLKLETRKASMPVFVIDHVEREPTDN